MVFAKCSCRIMERRAGYSVNKLPEKLPAPAAILAKTCERIRLKSPAPLNLDEGRGVEEGAVY
jgi:hypothetical protein